MCCNWTFGRKGFVSVCIAQLCISEPFPPSVPNITFQTLCFSQFLSSFKNWKCFSFIVLCVNTGRQVSLYTEWLKRKKKMNKKAIIFHSVQLSPESRRDCRQCMAHTYTEKLHDFFFDFRNFICLHFENRKNELPEADVFVSVCSRRWLISVKLQYFFFFWLSPFDFQAYFSVSCDFFQLDATKLPIESSRNARCEVNYRNSRSKNTLLMNKMVLNVFSFLLPLCHFLFVQCLYVTLAGAVFFNLFPFFCGSLPIQLHKLCSFVFSIFFTSLTIHFSMFLYFLHFGCFPVTALEITLWLEEKRGNTLTQ